MAQSKIKFEIEFDSYKDSNHYVQIEELDEIWQRAAKDVLGETAEKRKEGIQKLKVIFEKQHNTSAIFTLWGFLYPLPLKLKWKIVEEVAFDFQTRSSERVAYNHLL